MIEMLAYALMTLGVFCSLVGGVGLIRFPDVYTRLHANTVLVVGGVMVLLLATAIFAHTWSFSVKAILIAVFLFITNPVGAHAIARAAHRSGVPLWKESVSDALREEAK